MVGGAAILINLFLLLYGIFGDPGVKPETYVHYSKNWYSNGKFSYTSDSDSNDEEKNDDAGSDEESTGNAKRRNFMQNKQAQREAKL